MTDEGTTRGVTTESDATRVGQNSTRLGLQVCLMVSRVAMDEAKCREQRRGQIESSGSDWKGTREG